MENENNMTNQELNMLIESILIIAENAQDKEEIIEYIKRIQGKQEK